MPALFDTLEKLLQEKPYLAGVRDLGPLLSEIVGGDVVHDVAVVCIYYLRGPGSYTSGCIWIDDSFFLAPSVRHSRCCRPLWVTPNIQGSSYT